MALMMFLRAMETVASRAMMLAVAWKVAVESKVQREDSALLKLAPLLSLFRWLALLLSLFRWGVQAVVGRFEVR